MRILKSFEEENKKVPTRKESGRQPHHMRKIQAVGGGVEPPRGS